jgi:hypothetical protein
MPRMKPDKLLPTIALIFGLMSPAAHGFSVLRWGRPRPLSNPKPRRRRTRIRKGQHK